MSEPSAVDTSALSAALAGELVTSADPGWDAARQAWNLAADQHPALVVQAEGPQDVLATVRFAAANGLRVAPQSTGHGAVTLGDLSGAILLRTDRMAAVTIDTGARTARIGAGARWAEVIGLAAEHGLAAPHGLSGTVGVAGYTLGGGIGWLARSHGFASTHVRSFEVVTAAGEQRHVDADHDADLFWALRGGGGSPVVVTSIELELFAMREAFAGSLLWPIERASEVVHAYREWIATVPDGLTSTVRLIRFPPAPEIPEPIRGGAFVSITLALTGDLSDAEGLIAPLRDLGQVHLDTVAMVPITALGQISGDPPGPLPGISYGLLLERLTAEAVDTFVELAGPGSDSPLIQLELRHLGGALASPGADAGAAGALSAQALLFGVGAPLTPQLGEAIQANLTTVDERFGRWAASRRTLMTFDERDGGVSSLLDSDAAERLAGIAAAHDPGGLFLANHVPG